MNASSPQPRLSLLPASQPDLVRANEKDISYSELLIDSCQQAVRHLLGPIRAMRLAPHSRLLALLLYNGLTTGCGLQTLGEEYVSMMQARGESGQAPSLTQRIALVALQSLGPYLGEWVSPRLERSSRELPSPSAMQLVSPLPTFSSLMKGIWIKAAEAWPSRLRPLLVFASKLHLALFYIYGSFYRITHRLCGITYITTSRPLQPHGTYRALGWMLLAQLSISAALGVSEPLLQSLSISSNCRTKQGLSGDHSSHPLMPAKLILRQDEEEDDEGASTPHTPPPQCPLCLSPRTNPTSTPCGHVFCWECIARWCSEPSSKDHEGSAASSERSRGGAASGVIAGGGECPLCRADVHPSQLVPLYHVDG